MTGLEIQENLSALARGLRCTGVELYALSSWSFDFEGQFGLNVQCPWRIINEHGLALGSEDDGQKFGLPAPVDGAAVATQLLSRSALRNIIFTEKTGDVAFEFESGVRLEVFNNSSGYEGWNCGMPSGLQVIGMGGGGTANAAATR